MWPERLSFNDMVAGPRKFDELLSAAGKAGVTGIGLHIHVIEDFGVQKAIRLARDAGIAITNYSAAGHWASGVDYAGRPRKLEDAIRTLDEAAEFGTDIVGITAGRLASDDRDLHGARRRVVEGLQELLPHARDRNIRLAIEPVHPIFGGNGPILPTLRHTLDVIDEINQDGLGVLLDTYHLWWEPDLAEQLERAGDRTYLVQVSDWDPEMVARNWRLRAMTGEGVIDWSVFINGLKSFEGWWDYEGINDEVCPSIPLPELFEKIGSSFQETVGRHLTARFKK